MRRRHYQTEDEAKSDFPDDEFYTFIDGILTVRISAGRPFVLLREHEGLYWQRSDR